MMQFAALSPSLAAPAAQCVYGLCAFGFVLRKKRTEQTAMVMSEK